MGELNGALIGYGFFAINQMHAWNDVSDAKIMAICDRDPERLKIVGDQFGIESRYTDAPALFADGGIDFIDIAAQFQAIALWLKLPPPTRCQQSARSLLPKRLMMQRPW